MNALDMLWARAYESAIASGLGPETAEDYANERVREALDDE
jgi:hypothetical protein